jgi:hypothetical protein
MHDRARLLTIISIVLSFLSVLCLSYSTLNRFQGRELGVWTADGSVPKTPEYAAWQATNDKFARAGLVLVVIATVVQIVAVGISPRE